MGMETAAQRSSIRQCATFPDGKKSTTIAPNNGSNAISWKIHYLLGVCLPSINLARKPAVAQESVLPSSTKMGLYLK